MKPFLIIIFLISSRNPLSVINVLLYFLKQQINMKDGEPNILRLALIGDIPEIITLLLLYKQKFYPKCSLISKDSENF